MDLQELRENRTKKKRERVRVELHKNDFVAAYERKAAYVLPDREQKTQKTR